VRRWFLKRSVSVLSCSGLPSPRESPWPYYFPVVPKTLFVVSCGSLHVRDVVFLFWTSFSERAVLLSRLFLNFRCLSEAPLSQTTDSLLLWPGSFFVRWRPFLAFSNPAPTIDGRGFLAWCPPAGYLSSFHLRFCLCLFHELSLAVSTFSGRRVAKFLVGALCPARSRSLFRPTFQQSPRSEISRPTCSVRSTA